MRLFILSMILFALSACGANPQLQVIKLSEVSKEELNEARKVKIYQGDSNNVKVRKYLDDLHATSCKNMTWDPPATKGNAMQQLRIKAHRLGANAVINVYFDKSGTDTLGTNCWSSVTATGTAVVMEE